MDANLLPTLPGSVIISAPLAVSVVHLDSEVASRTQYLPHHYNSTPGVPASDGAALIVTSLLSVPSKSKDNLSWNGLDVVV